MQLSQTNKKKLKELTEYQNNKLQMPDKGLTEEQILNFCVNLAHQIFITEEFKLITGE